MKVKPLLYVAGLVTLLGIAQVVQANELDSRGNETTLVRSLDESSQLGKLTVESKNGQVKLTLSEVKQTYANISGTVWTTPDKSDRQEVSLERNQEGNYVAFLKRDNFGEGQVFYLEFSAQANFKTIQKFAVQSLQWPIESVTTTSYTSTTIAESTSTSLPTTTVDALTTADVRTTSNTRASTTSGTLTAEPEAISIQPSFSITNLNYKTGSFDVVISNLRGISGLKAVKVPVWTDEKGQDDLVWYLAKKQANGSYKLTVNKRNHKNGVGIYHVHAYLEFAKGRLQGIGAKQTSLTVRTSGNIRITNVNTKSGRFDVVITDVTSASAIKVVLVPVWTDEKGQDDIKWYTATKQSNGSYKVSVQAKHHKNGKGLYHAHLYYQYTNGRSEGVASTRGSLVATSGKISIANLSPQAGSFDVIISNVSAAKSISEIKVPVWSESKGQDDLIWYVAKRQANGTYKVSVQKKQHKNSTGVYHAHLYYRYSDGELEGVGGTKTSLSQPKPPVKKIVTTKKTTKPTTKKTTTKKKVQEPQTKIGRLTGNLKVTNVNATAGTFDVLVSNVVAPQSVSAVKIPVWTEKDGQDDIVWYEGKRQSDGTYKVTIYKQDHKKETGLYHVHLYYAYSDGSQTGVAATKTTLPAYKSPSSNKKLAGTISFQNINRNKGTFDVVISNLSAPKEIEIVKVPIWSEINGQDDIIWYEAKRQSSGTYKVTVAAKDHLYDVGYYQVHLYYQYSDGSQSGVASARTQVSIRNTTPSAKIEIRDVDNTYGLFDVVVSDIFAPAGIEKIEIPVWSDANGRGDLIWYEAVKQTDGTFRITVRLTNHAYETGSYNAHLYITSAGQRYGIGGTTARVSYTQKSGNSFIDVSSHNGSLSVEDYRKMMNQGIAGVVVKLTEGTSYLNPYAEEQIRNARAAGLKISVYHYSHFVDAKTAKEEAQYFVAAAKRFGLPTTTTMVNDIEEYKTRANINANMQEWENEMRRLGYHNLIHYTGASWIDKSGLGYSGPIKTGQFGISNFWVAQYPYNAGMTAQQARAMALHARAAAWQFTSKAALLLGRSYFDLNIDYTGRFTN